MTNRSINRKSTQEIAEESLQGFPMYPVELQLPILEKLIVQVKKALDTLEAAEVLSSHQRGYEEGFARGQEKKASCVCSEFGSCGFHEPMIEKAHQRGFKEGADKRRCCYAVTGVRDMDDKSMCPIHKRQLSVSP